MMSAALLFVMTAVLIMVILAGNTGMAERLNTVQGFAGVLVTAFVTLIGGYGISAHMDDRQHIDKGLDPFGDAAPVSVSERLKNKMRQRTGQPDIASDKPNTGELADGFDPVAMAARYANENVGKIRPKLPKMTGATK